MPARKPADLNRRHETAAETAQRAQNDAVMQPKRQLSATPPALLKGHKVAQAAWRRLMRIYSELEAVIVTKLDTDMLCDYCMLIEQVAELDAMRRSAVNVWEAMSAAFDSFEGSEDNRYDMAQKVQTALADVVKFDGRADRKRDLLFKLRQSLYLTPRARAGAAPAKKEKEPEKDPLEQLLDEVTDYMNGGA
jgi:phage terminase small subunit